MTSTSWLRTREGRRSGGAAPDDGAEVGREAASAAAALAEDLRDLRGVEAFCALLDSTLDRLDVVVNNACQTVRRPAAPLRHLTLGQPPAQVGHLHRAVASPQSLTCIDRPAAWPSLALSAIASSSSASSAVSQRSRV